MELPAEADLTVNVATPLALLLAEAGEIVSVPAPRLDPKVRVFPETGFP
jgi:hypothetical protein